MLSPEYEVTGADARLIHMQRYTELETGLPMLIRAIVEETPTELIVVTVYVASKISKYLRGVASWTSATIKKPTP